jgi:hypothetical protein
MAHVGGTETLGHSAIASRLDRAMTVDALCATAASLIDDLSNAF